MRCPATRLALVAFIAFASLASCKGGGDPGAATPSPAVDATAKPLSVGLVFDIGGRGDNSFNDSAARGIEKALIGHGLPLYAAAIQAQGCALQEMCR